VVLPQTKVRLPTIVQAQQLTITLQKAQKVQNFSFLSSILITKRQQLPLKMGDLPQDRVKRTIIEIIPYLKRSKMKASKMV